jgi:hypothetical protein
MKVMGISERQQCGRWLNNRAENAHQPFRRREGAMAKLGHKDPPEVCIRSRLLVQSLQHGPPPHPPRHLQEEPSCRYG